VVQAIDVYPKRGTPRIGFVAHVGRSVFEQMDQLVAVLQVASFEGGDAPEADRVGDDLFHYQLLSRRRRRQVSSETLGEFCDRLKLFAREHQALAEDAVG
jgi:hypothetical protein